MKSKNQLPSPAAQAPEVRTDHYRYELPNERIALHPLQNRDQSKLLVATSHPLRIQDRVFSDLSGLLPEGSLLIVNDSKVLPARILCRKPTGGAAEVLLLEPLRPTSNPSLCLTQGSPGTWRALVGGKRIRPGDRLEVNSQFQMHILEKHSAEALVELLWSPADAPLAQILEEVGSLPLPPYLKRELVAADQLRYQTVYSQHLGSVAAPTAGLHFTDSLRAELKHRGVREERLTLHVGAGTFKPVEAERVAGHEMHAERFEVTRSTIESLAQSLKPVPGRPPVIAVGTTSLRTLESLYWLGVRALRDPKDELRELEQWEAYAPPQGAEVLPWQAFDALLEHLDSRSLSRLVARSQLMIVPGYSFKTADWLITNFHQPGSSLILLVAAWMGEAWREVYQHALESKYRFLSYGDSSLLMRTKVSAWVQSPQT